MDDYESQNGPRGTGLSVKENAAFARGTVRPNAPTTPSLRLPLSSLGRPGGLARSAAGRLRPFPAQAAGRIFKPGYSHVAAHPVPPVWPVLRLVRPTVLTTIIITACPLVSAFSLRAAPIKKLFKPLPQTVQLNGTTSLLPPAFLSELITSTLPTGWVIYARQSDNPLSNNPVTTDTKSNF